MATPKGGLTNALYSVREFLCGRDHCPQWNQKLHSVTCTLVENNTWKVFYYYADFLVATSLCRYNPETKSTDYSVTIASDFMLSYDYEYLGHVAKKNSKAIQNHVNNVFVLPTRFDVNEKYYDLRIPNN